VRLAVELELRGIRLDEDGVLVLARQPRISLPLSVLQSNLSTFSRPTSMKPSVAVSPQKIGILTGESLF
jgi:hypothetical protein